MTDRQTDGLTDGQTDRVQTYSPLRFHRWGTKECKPIVPSGVTSGGLIKSLYLDIYFSLCYRYFKFNVDL